MDALRIHGKPKLRAEFNWRLICKQRVSGSKSARRLTILESRTSPSGVVASSYARAGEVKLGSFVLTGSSQEATRDERR